MNRYDPNSFSHITSGQRVTIHTYSFCFGEYLHSNSNLKIENRGGVVITGPEENSMLTNIFNFFVADDNPMKSSIIIALDHPLNSADGYLRERRKISQKYSIPGEGRQIVILTKQLLQSNLVRLTIVPSNYPINAIAIVKCEVCQGFNYRSRMLCGCSLNHMCCAHHLMPYDRETGKATFEEARPVYFALTHAVNMMRSQSVQRFAMDFSCLETLAMLLCHKWDEYQTEQQRQMFMSEIMNVGIRLFCPCCKSNGYGTRQSALSMVRLDHELFPTPEERVRFHEAMNSSTPSKRALSQQGHSGTYNTSLNSNFNEQADYKLADNVDKKKQLNPTVRMQLISAGVELGLIKRLEMDNPDDASSMDLDLAMILIESYRTSAPRPSSATMPLDSSGALNYNYIVPNAVARASLSSALSVVLVSPFGSSTAARSLSIEPVTIPAGKTYTDIALQARQSTCSAPWVMALPPTELTLYVVRPRSSPYQAVQCRDEISDSSTDPEQDRFTICLRAIRAGAVVELRTTKDNVGPRMLLEKLAADFRHNSSMVAKITRLETAYSGYRRMRGDGNCYFRAAIFGLLETIIEHNRRHLFRELHSCFMHYISMHGSYISEEEVQMFAAAQDSAEGVVNNSANMWHGQINRFLEALLLASENRMWATVDELEADILRDNQDGMDDAMIRACRRLVSAFLMQNRTTEVNGILLEDAILPSFPDCQSMKDYCLRYIDCMGVDAEGPFVYLGVVFIALRCYGLTVLFDRRKDVMLNFFETDPACIPAKTNNGYSNMSSASSPASPSLGCCVHLLLRPGHYDLLKPVQSDHASGRPSLSCDDLTRLCGEKPKPRAVETGTGGASAQGGSRDGNAVTDADLARQLTNKLQESFPSLVRNITSQPANRTALEKLQALPRVVLTSIYPHVRQSKGLLVHRSEQNDLKESKCLFLRGTDEELKAVAMKAYSINSLRTVTVTQHLSSCQQLEVLNVHVRGIVTLQVDCTAIGRVDRGSLFSRNHLFYEHGNVLFKVTVDMGLHSNFKQLLQAICEGLQLPPDCFCREGDLKDALYELSDQQAYDADMTMTLTLMEGKMITFNDPTTNTSIPVTFTESGGIYGLINLATTALHLPPGSPAKLRTSRSVLLSDQDCAALLDRDVVYVSYCSVCRMNMHPHPNTANANSNSSSSNAAGNDDSLYSIGTCGHTVCGNCIGDHLRTIRVTRQKLAYEPDASTPSVQTFHNFPSKPELPLPAECEAGNYMPQLIPTLRCPVRSCTSCISGEGNVSSHILVENDFVGCMTEMEDYIKHLSAMRTCSLYDVMFCDEHTHVADLFQLNCGHFFHKACIAGYMRTEIEKARTNATQAQMVCYQCTLEKTTCYCMSCEDWRDRGDNLGHIYTDHEVGSLVASGDLTAKDKENWANIMSIISVRNLPGTVLVPCPYCESQFTATQTQMAGDELICPMSNCRKTICPRCRNRSHADITCDKLAQQMQKQAMIDAGIKFIQQCPNCYTPWNLPIDCLHVTCEGPNGCGQQFCFLCAAPYTATTTHGAWYHRPGCTTYSRICDCVQQEGVLVCLATDPMATCAKSKYWPGPCDACIAAKTINTCTHGLGNWRACNTCIRGNIQCKHYCLECRKKGSLCTPPGNPPDPEPDNPDKLKFECFDRQAVLDEAARLAPPGGGGHGHGHK